MTRHKNESIRLEEGVVLRIDDGASLRVSPSAGCVWITQEGDRRDHILRAGESLLLDRDRLTLVQALAPSVLSITAP